MNDNYNFLYKFNNKLKDLLNDKTISYAVIKTKLAKKALNIYTYTNPNLINNLNNTLDILDKIYYITNNYKTNTTVSETIKRASDASITSNEDFIKTLNDSTLWHNNDDKLTPEYIYTNEIKEDILTYENKFIIFLFHKIIDYISELNKSSLSKLNSLEDYYRQDYMSFSNTSFVNDLALNIEQVSKYLLIEDKNNEINTLFNKIYKKIKYIKNSKFYNILKNEHINLPILKTNILLYDTNYHYCYNYYLTNKDYYNLESNDEIYYSNYVKFRILKYILDKDIYINEDFKMYFKDEILVLENLNFSYLDFNISINSNELDLSLIINILDLKEEYLIIPKINLINREKNINNKNLIYFVLNNKTNSYKDCLIMSYFKKQDNINELDTLFKSISILIRNPKKITDKCFSCGSLDTYEINNEIRCNNCNSIQANVNINRKNYTWIKRYSLKK